MSSTTDGQTISESDGQLFDTTTIQHTVQQHTVQYLGGLGLLPGNGGISSCFISLLLIRFLVLLFLSSTYFSLYSMF